MKKDSSSMPHAYSLYLDMVRFLAAVAVFLDHISSYPFTKNVFWYRLGSYGGVAVMIFFVLSGYVIAYVTSTRERFAFQYASARIARIYSVVLVALLITLLFDSIGAALNPAFYSIQKILWKPESVEGYISSLFFVNEYQIFHFNGIAPGSNGPYWSLSFEVTYYLVAGLFLFARRWIALPLIMILMVLAGRTVAALLPIWVLGYILYFVRLNNISKSLLYAGFTVSTILLVLTPVLADRLPQNNFGLYFPWGRGPFNRNLIEDYLSAFFFALNVVCAREILRDVGFLAGGRIESLIRWLGSLTFPLYLIHFPALALFSSISPWSNESVGNVLFIGLLTFALVIFVAPFCDRLKNAMKNGMQMVSRLKTV